MKFVPENTQKNWLLLGAPYVKLGDIDIDSSLKENAIQM